MSTFFGGEQFVEAVKIQNDFTPSDLQAFDIYTIPNGHFALLKLITILGTEFQANNEFNIELRRNYNSAIEYSPQLNDTNDNTPYVIVLASSNDGYYGPIKNVLDVGQLQIMMSNSANTLSIMESRLTEDIQNNPIRPMALMQKDFYCDEGETIKFRSRTFANQRIFYNIHLHLYKKP